MVDKNFLIISENENNITLEQKVAEFVKNTFGELGLDKISIEIYRCILQRDMWKEGMDIKIEFNDFKYFDKAYGECVETIWLKLEEKGLQPFYIDGKFQSLRVFERISGMPIQKTDIIYGVHKDKLYDDFNNYILTC